MKKDIEEKKEALGNLGLTLINQCSMRRWVKDIFRYMYMYILLSLVLLYCEYAPYNVFFMDF